MSEAYTNWNNVKKNLDFFCFMLDILPQKINNTIAITVKLSCRNSKDQFLVL